MSAWPVALLLLVLVYVLALGSFALADLGLGGLIAGALLLVLRRFLWSAPRLRRRGTCRRVLAFLPFAGAVLRDIVSGTWDVALRVLHLRRLGRPGIVAIPMAERTPTGVAVSALIMTLSPGSVLVDVDWEQRVMHFHVIDATDPEALRTVYQELYHRYQRHVFP